MGQVQLILREEVRKLGQAGDLVEVKPGYARNFLIPQGKAMIATPSKVHELEHQKRMIETRLPIRTVPPSRPISSTLKSCVIRSG